MKRKPASDAAKLRPRVQTGPELVCNAAPDGSAAPADEEGALVSGLAVLVLVMIAWVDVGTSVAAAAAEEALLSARQRKILRSKGGLLIGVGVEEDSVNYLLSACRLRTHMHDAVCDRHIRPENLGCSVDRDDIDAGVVADDLEVLTRARHEIVSVCQDLRVKDGAVDELVSAR